MTLELLQAKLEEVVTYDDLDRLEEELCTRCRRSCPRGGCRALSLIQDWREFILPALRKLV